MSARSPEELAAALSDELRPVRALPPLRRQLAEIAAVCAVTAIAVAFWLGLDPSLVLARGETSAGLGLALALIAGAGISAAVASRVPGRERVVKCAVASAGLGVALALVTFRDSTGDAGTFEQLSHCALRSLLVAAPAAIWVTRWAARGAPWRPRGSGLAATIGAAGFGGLLIHLSCPSPSSQHWLLAHALAPLAAGALLGLAAGALLARGGGAS